MNTEHALKNRCDNKCELCAATSDLLIYDVPPDSDGTPESCILICSTCQQQLAQESDLNVNHWRCLNDSMWSSVSAVQVVAWRQLNKLASLGEIWAQDLLDVFYLEDHVRQWAESLATTSEHNPVTLDSNGTPLQSGDTVTIIKDLQVKGANFTAKRGTAVRNISLTSNPEHIEGRVNGQRIVLLSCYLKKSG